MEYSKSEKVIVIVKLQYYVNNKKNNFMYKLIVLILLKFNKCIKVLRLKVIKNNFKLI